MVSLSWSPQGEIFWEVGQGHVKYYVMGRYLEDNLGGHSLCLWHEPTWKMLNPFLVPFHSQSQKERRLIKFQ